MILEGRQVCRLFQRYKENIIVDYLERMHPQNGWISEIIGCM